MKRTGIDVEYTKTRAFADYLKLLKSRQTEPTFFWGTIIGILVGAFFALAGFVLVILGASGAIDWLVEIDDFKAKMINACPGVIFAVLGTIILWRYKPKRIERIDLENLKSYQFYHHPKASPWSSSAKIDPSMLDKKLKLIGDNEVESAEQNDPADP